MVDPGSERVSFSNLVASMGASGVGLFSQMDTLLRAAGVGVEDEGEAGAAELDEETAKRAASMPPGERKQRLEAGLSATREIIDTLTMLEKKTQGNLNDSERELLTSVLTELRLGYTRMADRVAGLAAGDDGEGSTGEADG